MADQTIRAVSKLQDKAEVEKETGGDIETEGTEGDGDNETSEDFA